MTYAATPTATPRRATLAAPLVLGLVAIAGTVRTGGGRETPWPHLPKLSSPNVWQTRGSRIHG
jgi:hypothetical protein